MDAQQSILIIDDDFVVADIVAAAVQLRGWDCTVTTTAPQFLSKLTPEINLIFVDLMMPEMDGIELLRLLAQQGCKAGIVLMSGVKKRVLESAIEMTHALELDVVGYLRKPFELSALDAILELRNNRQTARAIPPKQIFLFSDDELRQAITNENFVIHYQPQVEIATRRVVAVEALVRWNHPTLGLIYPEYFITRLEALGLIDRLGMMVAERAMRDMARFRDPDGFTPMLSINVSARSICDLKFPDDIEQLARSFGVPADKITIEITESDLVSELSRTLDVLTRLRLKNVHLSIDDFGTGYSMMKQLRHIPATEIKIDRSFVQKIHLSYGDRVVVQKTIEIGHELGLKVIAEGVETLQQLEFLKQTGCDLVQGYLFSQALAAEALTSWLSQYRAGQTLTIDSPLASD